MIYPIAKHWCQVSERIFINEGTAAMNRILLSGIIVIGTASLGRADVVLVKTPDRGIQPQTVVDAKGNLHLLYFKGEPKAGNLMYVRRDAGKADFATPIQVNTQDGSAIAV